MSNNEKNFLNFLLERFIIEREKFDRSGVYAYTQRLLAYNSNKIEDSTLTEKQTACLFDNGTLPKSDDYYRAKDVEEMDISLNGRAVTTSGADLIRTIMCL